MNKLICVFLCILLLPCAVLCEEVTPDFVRLTGLDKAQELLDCGAAIDRIYYTDGFGFSTSEFETADETEIDALWKAVNEIIITGKTDEDITDWYPQIVFFFSDGSHLNICFDAHWLEVGMDHYALGNDEAFWELTAVFVAAYAGEDVEESILWLIP